MKISTWYGPAAKAGVVALGLLLSGCATMCPGRDAGGPPPPGHGPMPPPPPPEGRPDPAFDQALQACAAEQGITLPPRDGKPPKGAGEGKADAPRPDREKLDACLFGKGFERPAGPPPGGMGGPGGPGGPGMPPHRHHPRDPAFEAAFKACAAEQGVQFPEPAADGKPGDGKPGDRPKLDALDRDKLGACLEQKGIKRPGPGPDDKAPAPADR